MTTRKSMSKRLRFDVFKRDGFTCQYCGAHPPAVLLHVDHITPVAGGGENDIDNLVTSCAPCNLGKSDVPLSVVPKTLSEKAHEVAEREEQLRGYQQILTAVRDRLEDEAFEIAYAIFPHKKGEPVRKDWLQSIKMFLKRLGFHEVHEAAEKADSLNKYSPNTTFKYFCGVCWKKIKRMESSDE